MDIQPYKENQKTRFLAEEYERLLNKKAETLELAQDGADDEMKTLAEEESKQIDTQ